MVCVARGYGILAWRLLGCRRCCTSPHLPSTSPLYPLPPQHASISYYWVLVLMFFVSPALAYNFSELIEAHAVDTYGAAAALGGARTAWL